MSIQHTVNRVSTGLPGAGRFAPGQSPESAGLTLATGPTFDDDFDARHGEAFAAELQALPAADAFTRVPASRTADILREACENHWPAGTQHTNPDEARASFRASIGNLSDERAGHHLALVGFAISQEMKQAGNREHILNPEHAWEVLIDTTDYRSNDELVDDGGPANQEAWETLTDTAMAAALSENSAAALRLTA